MAELFAWRDVDELIRRSNEVGRRLDLVEASLGGEGLVQEPVDEHPHCDEGQEVYDDQDEVLDADALHAASSPSVTSPSAAGPGRGGRVARSSCSQYIRPVDPCMGPEE